jgi:hypothetical protein
MSIRAILLTAAAALVALGGIYLLVQVRASGASAPSATAVAEAAARHARTAPPNTRHDEGPGIPRPDRTPDAGSAKRGRFAKPDIAAFGGGTFNARPGGETADPPAVADDANPDFEIAMSETNKLYDRQQFDEARTMALKLLEKKPGTVRMLRVVVSSSCVLGDEATAKKYAGELPEADRDQMATRCERFDIKLN